MLFLADAGWLVGTVQAVAQRHRVPLLERDQDAIVAIVGRPLVLVGYDEDGRAELHFDDPFDGRADGRSHIHSIWAAPEFIERHRA